MVFGKVLADNVKTEQVRIFMDKRGLGQIMNWQA